MGSWDCYCALCAGPLGCTIVDLGDKSAKALRKRRKRVERLKRKKAGEEIKSDDEDGGESADENGDQNEEGQPKAPNLHLENPTGDLNSKYENENMERDDDAADKGHKELLGSTSSGPSKDSVPTSTYNNEPDLHIGPIEDVSTQYPRDSDTWSQASEISTWEGFSHYHNVAEGDKNYEWREEASYDPSLLQPSDLQWLHRCRAIGLNPDAPGISKAFISGRGYYDDYGSFKIKQPSTDPNFATEVMFHTCYYLIESGGEWGEHPCFPFHEACFRILAKTLGFDNPLSVNKDMLYDVMHEFSREYGPALVLDYGPVPNTEQFWDTEAGEEFRITDPGPSPGLGALLQTMLPSSLFKDTTAPTTDLAHKIKNDIFQLFPYDVIHNICTYIELEDAFSLMQASWYVLATTRVKAFWKYVMRTRMAWFWELSELFEETNLPFNFDFKGLYLWLDRVTTPEFGMRGPLLGIANRRRIWNTCLSLAEHYDIGVDSGEYQEPDDKTAEVVLNSAVSPHVPVVMYPYPSDAKPVSAQLIRSWEETHQYPCELSAYWNSSGYLVGISVQFGNDRRVFGDDTAATVERIHIRTHDWIEQITLVFDHLPLIGQDGMWVQDGDSASATHLDYMGITGLNVSLNSDGHWLNDNEGPNYLKLLVLPGMYMVGLTGTIAPNGVISSIGLLQAPEPGKKEVVLDELPLFFHQLQNYLFMPSARTLRNKDQTYHGHILSHETYSLYEFPTSTNAQANAHTNPFTPHQTLLPHDIFLWTEWPSRYRPFIRLSATQVSGRCYSPDSTEPRYSTDIIGIQATHKENKYNHTGTGGPVHTQLSDWNERTDYDFSTLKESLTPFADAHTSHFDINGAAGEVVTEVHWCPAAGALKLVTNHGREVNWGGAVSDEGAEWHVKRMEPWEIIVGLQTCFGKPGGWSEGAKRYGHWGLSDVGVVLAKLPVESLEKREKWLL